mmetsp:Transcript_92970/g.289855  ORF Transcript_92970/g.289855 Transcript_92970/m.289855 type:complete len:138 (-) Transcript_92970:77-490(-)
MGAAKRFSLNRSFKLSDEEKAKYQEIAGSVKAKGKDIDAKAAVERIAASAVAVAEAQKPANEADEIPTSDSDFVGVLLGPIGGCTALSGGELEVNLDDVYIDEPRVVAEEEDEEKGDEEERSLWGDGDADPAEKADD